MPIGLLTLEIHIPDARSLKDKRQVLRSLKDRLRAHFNVAVAELEHQELWQRSLVGVVSISGDGKHLEESLRRSRRNPSGFWVAIWSRRKSNISRMANERRRKHHRRTSPRAEWRKKSATK